MIYLENMHCRKKQRNSFMFSHCWRFQRKSNMRLKAEKEKNK